MDKWWGLKSFSSWLQHLLPAAAVLSHLLEFVSGLLCTPKVDFSLILLQTYLPKCEETRRLMAFLSLKGDFLGGGSGTLLVRSHTHPPNHLCKEGSQPHLPSEIGCSSDLLWDMTAPAFRREDLSGELLQLLCPSNLVSLNQKGYRSKDS